MSKIFQILKVVFDREQRLAYTLSEFAHQNPDLLIIVADPKTDKLFIGYKDKHVLNKINSAEGKKLRVVRNILKRSTFAGSIDYFQVALMETLQVHLKQKHFNLFLQWIDGAVYNIGKALGADKKHPQRVKSEPVGQKSTGVPSPLSRADIINSK
jgi:hypothetical protein